jgi:hypothetical protein
MGIFLGGRGRRLDHLGESGDEHLGDVTEGDSDGEDEEKEEDSVEGEEVFGEDGGMKNLIRIVTNAAGLGGAALAHKVMEPRRLPLDLMF